MNRTDLFVCRVWCVAGAVIVFVMGFWVLPGRITFDRGPRLHLCRFRGAPQQL